VSAPRGVEPGAGVSGGRGVSCVVLCALRALALCVRRAAARGWRAALAGAPLYREHGVERIAAAPLGVVVDETLSG